MVLRVVCVVGYPFLGERRESEIAVVSILDQLGKRDSLREEKKIKEYKNINCMVFALERTTFGSRFVQGFKME